MNCPTPSDRSYGVLVAREPTCFRRCNCPLPRGTNTSSAFTGTTVCIDSPTLIGIKLGFQKTGEHEVVVSEIEHGVDRYRVAATLLPVSKGSAQGYLLTNVCLKYTREQFTRVRQEYGGCRVIGEYCSGDGSVLFQLSEYCADHAAVN